MENDMSTSQTSNSSSNGSSHTSKKTAIISPDPTAYVTKARVTRPTPPPPPYNPMQFVQIKPCNLYQSAQEQLKKAEEVKKIKEIRKEEPEDWQNNLDNWKSSRRKRVEHIIDRVVEVKKLELEEHDRTHRKSKTFFEMIEGRGERTGRGLNKLASLAVYNEDESNDLSDLGIGTSSASGKSSLSDDYDNNSVMSDNINESQKTVREQNNKQRTNNTTREYISSPGYETSSSTAPASSPDPCEYTYEGAIQDYKQRVSRAASGLTSLTLNKLSTTTTTNKHLKNSNTNGTMNSKDSTPERLTSNGNTGNSESYPPRRGSKIEDRLIGFEVQSPSEENVDQKKVDVPKIDISKRKEIFESNQQIFKNSNNNEPKSTADAANSENENGPNNGVNVPRNTLKNCFKRQSSSETARTKGTRHLSSDITSIKERLQSLEQQQQKTGSCTNELIKTSTLTNISSVPPLKERLSSLQNAATKEEIRKPPVKLVDARQLEIMKTEEEKAKKVLKDIQNEKVPILDTNEILIRPSINRIRKGNIQKVDEALVKGQDNQLHTTIEALAMEEKQLTEAANVVNQIEAEFEEMNLNTLPLAPLATSSLNVTASSPITSNINEMEYSVSSTNRNFSYNRRNSINSNDSTNVNICSVYGNNSLLSGEVEGISALKSTIALKSSAALQRRSTNEMIHAKNLLKMFKETFPNDIHLDKNVNVADFNGEVSHAIQPSSVEGDIFENNRTVKNFNNSSLNFSVLGEKKLTTKPPKCPVVRPCSPICQTVRLPTTLESFSLPKIARTSSTLVHYFPSSERHAESPININGRVEIFNSKYMNSTSSNSLSPTSIPTTTTKKSKASYTSDIEKKAIIFPKQQDPEEEEEPHQLKLSAKSITTLQTVTKSIPSVVNKEKRNNPNEIQSKPMKTRTTANEPNKNCYQLTNKIITDEQQQRQYQQQQEVVVCAPTVTVLNPKELPKPNTVKKISCCFQQHQSKQFQQQQQLTTSGTVNVQDSNMIPQTSPQPLPRTLLAVKNPSSVIVTNNQMPIIEKPSNLDALEEKEKTLSLISTSSGSSTSSSDMCSVIEVNKPKANDVTSSSSSDSTIIVAHTTVLTQAQIHIKEKEEHISNFTLSSNMDNKKEKKSENKLLLSKLTNDTINVKPANMPPLLICTPNDSSLYKLAASSPQSPRKQLDISPFISSSAKVERDIALCSGQLSSLAISPNKTYFQRQKTIEEVPFEKIESQDNRPPRSTGYSEIDPVDIKNTQIASCKTKRQISLKEEPCNKVDVFSLPVGKQELSTKSISVSPTDIRKSDHFFGSVRGPLKPLSKPNSPIMAARAAHSRALIETCEKIIAEEKLASSQLKSTLPISPRSTPILGKKSKLPKPLICCKPIESISEADINPIERPVNKTSPQEEADGNVVIARTHVVETQIKVTTSTPPSSPKCKVKSLQPLSPSSQRSPKKPKNIFDFLKRNFGVGSSHLSNENLTINTDVSLLSDPQKITLRNESPQEVPEEIVIYDEIHIIDNSKFYLPSNEVKPPPLPQTPAPVNIEIKKCFITDEIVEDGKTELDLTREINELLDEELTKLNNKTKSCT